MGIKKEFYDATLPKILMALKSWLVFLKTKSTNAMVIFALPLVLIASLTSAVNVVNTQCSLVLFPLVITVEDLSSLILCSLENLWLLSFQILFGRICLKLIF